MVESDAKHGGVPASAGLLKVDMEGHIRLNQPTPSVFVLGQLAQFAQQTATGNWRITAESIQRAVGRGLTLDQVLALLSELSSSEVPLTLEKQIRKWSGFFGQASLQAVMLLTLASVDALTALMADEEIGPHLTPIEGSSKPLAIVADAHAERVKMLLVERGVVLK